MSFNSTDNLDDHIDSNHTMKAIVEQKEVVSPPRKKVVIEKPVISKVDHMDVSETKADNEKSIKDPKIVELMKRIEELEAIVKALQNNKINVESNDKEIVSNNKTSPIPSHLMPVNPEHLPLLKNLRMKLEAVGNGMCLTNCASMHMMEDDSLVAMVNMKSKINNHIADHYDEHYHKLIGLPYCETVMGEVDLQVCTTNEELKEFLRSERGLKVFSNIQEAQALANVFNTKIEIFTHGIRSDGKGGTYRVAHWMEPILPQPEVAHFAEYKPGHFPPMQLYHSTETHFDLLVPDNSRLALNGLLATAPKASCDQMPLKEQEVLEVSTKEQEVQVVGPIKPHVSASEVLVKASDDEWKTIKVKKTTNKPTTQTTNKLPFVCDNTFKDKVCGAELESAGLLYAHKQNHEAHRPKSDFYCDMCDEQFTGSKKLYIHMKEEHEDGSWTCNDCPFQSNSNERLRKHLKLKAGHQPSEASKRQDIEIRKCYTCKNEFDGYKELMNHRKREHPSHIRCRNLPDCPFGDDCYYAHPSHTATTENVVHPISETPKITDIKIVCRTCSKEVHSKNQLLAHRKAEHKSSHIVCRDWLRSNCWRSDKECLFLHSNSTSSPTTMPPVWPTLQKPQQFQNQSEPVFQAPMPATQPPDQQSQIQQMMQKMTIQMNSMELQLTQSHQQMQQLQTILGGK